MDRIWSVKSTLLSYLKVAPLRRYIFCSLIVLKLPAFRSILQLYRLDGIFLTFPNMFFFTFCDLNLLEIKKEQSINIKLKHDMKCQRKELEQRTKELAECRTQNDLERKSLMDQIEEQKLKLPSRNPPRDIDLNTEITGLRNQLEENEDAPQYLESLNHTLTLKQSISNQELQDACKESISVFTSLFLHMV
ncbi:hypothetical protein Pint_06330 [Pistacia integerrima]|uniref:Uncharacterized protein n=1 Tax=Pistacia integerrima TaxID=434235 RepID=A0ACC0Z4X9_9ROSI|nr:hypothetical protein Pint_06330 [Pistacia integerrima]